MRQQPPDNNNPANPLIKVAALELDREYISVEGEQRLKVAASLTFQRSSDMRGKTSTKDGRKVNVTFGLKIKRASFKVECKDDLGNSPEGFVLVDKVAFSSPLVVRSKIEDAATNTRHTERRGSIGGKLQAQAGAEGLGAGASVNTQAQAQSSSTQTQKRQAKRRFERANISATHAGSEVYWEINPGSPNESLKLDDFLVGNVFLDGNRKAIDACIVRRRDGKPLADLEVIGSVFVGMKDLVIEDIEFIDDDGMEIRPSNLSEHSSSGFMDVLEFKKTAKERILKQIIRKHLIKQGLRVDGALVEICRAFT